MSATHDAAGHTGSPYQVPPEPNRWPAIGLAVGVHAMLLAFLYIGVSWQNNTPVAVEAEVWDVTTQTAAPPPPPPPPPPREAEPEPPRPTPAPVPVPKVAPPREVEEPVAPKQPDIALAREKKHREELKKQQRLEEEREERERERERELAQKREDAKKAKQDVEQKQREQAEKKELDRKKLADKEKAAKAEKEQAEKAEKAEKAAQEKADKLAKQKAEKAENAKLAKQRDENLKRMMEAAGSGTSGSAEKSTAPRIDKGYTAAITTKVKGNTSYAGSLDEPGNPTASFRVEQLPTGEIISVKKMKSSGVPSFDDAVEKGITKSSPLPKKKDGTVERSLLIEFHMKDLQ
jgi:colicin import membrane protein